MQTLLKYAYHKLTLQFHEMTLLNYYDQEENMHNKITKSRIYYSTQSRYKNTTFITIKSSGELPRKADPWVPRAAETSEPPAPLPLSDQEEPD